MISALVVLIVLQTAINFHRPFKLIFPADFMETIKKEKRAILSVFGDGKYTLLYAHHIYPEAEWRIPVGPCRLVLKSPHPLEYLPYQYEGHTPAQREKLRSTDISMRLVVSTDHHQ